MQFLDHIQCLLSTALGKQPSRAEGDDLATGKENEREDDLKRKRKSPGELSSWIGGRHEEAGVSQPAGEGVSKGIHDASDTYHGSSGFYVKHVSK